jgi:calcineurin-like phosphoesterase family protein
MNEALVANWNSVVQPEDTIYCLGDFSLAIRPVELYTPRLNGQKILIAGNHDWVHRSNKKSSTEEKYSNVLARYKECGWAEVYQQYTLKIGNGVYELSHMPYKGDSTDLRFQEYRLDDNGVTLLCGHVHEKWKTKKTPKNTLMINVGVDVNNFTPISLEEINNIIKLEGR